MPNFPPGPINFNAWCGLTWRHAWDQWRQPLAFCEGLAQRYGDIAFYRLFTYRAYQINHPELVRQVLVTQAKKFIKQPRQMALIRPITGKGLLNSEGALWQRQRRMLAPAFQAEQANQLTAAGCAEIQRTLDGWQDGATISLHEEMLRVTITATARALFHADLDGELQVIVDSMSGVSAGMIEDIASPFPIPRWFPSTRIQQKFKGLRNLTRFIAKIIARRRASGELGSDLLGLLLASVDAKDGEGMSDAQAHAEAMTFFFATHHTIAACLVWTLYLLVQNPDVEDRLVTELAQQAGNGPIVLSEASKLPYLERVLQESMRMFPPAWSLFARENTEEVELGGYRIPPGSWFFIYPWVLHHDPRFFPEPWRFDPDRFLPERAADIPKGSYIPFGIGSHACAGQRMAMQLMSSMLQVILQRVSFDLSPTQGPVQLEPVLSLRPLGDIRLVVHRRNLPSVTKHEMTLSEMEALLP